MRRLSVLMLGLWPLAAHAAEPTQVLVSGERFKTVLRIDETLVAPADSASLLKQAAGANINKHGELTGIAQYRGMYGDRVNVAIDGMVISPGGPNAMDAPLSYAPVALLDNVTIHRGIAPLSLAQESIGGHIQANSAEGEFGDGPAMQLGGRLYSGFQSVNEGTVLSGMLTLANQSHRYRLAVMSEQGDDSRIPGGRLLPSEYQRQRIDAGYAYRGEVHQFSIDYLHNATGDAGTPALPMDIESIDSNMLRGRYRWQGEQRAVEATLSLGRIDHYMSNYHLRRPPQNAQGEAEPGRFRRTFTTADNLNAAVKMENQYDWGLLRTGLDLHLSEHSALVGNPQNPGFALENFAGIRRDVYGLFAEAEFSPADHLELLAGIRFNHVDSRSGRVSAQFNPQQLSMGMPVMMQQAAGALAQRFNEGPRRVRDDNLDLFLRLNERLSDSVMVYAAVARKHRSPAYQERFLWLPMESTAGLADGFTYVGNPALKPELSQELELGLDIEQSGFSFSPRVFYREVDDFIQGMPAEDPAVRQVAAMMAMMGGGRDYPLQFSNVDARFYGADLESRYRLSTDWTLRLNASMVRGERRDGSGDRLYRIAPDNFLLALDYHRAGWTVSAEQVAYRRQRHVSSVHQELSTPGYLVSNLVARYQVSDSLELGLGINNLFDRYYEEHLGAYNRAFNPAVPAMARLPGLGRNVFGRLLWYF